MSNEILNDVTEGVEKTVKTGGHAIHKGSLLIGAAIGSTVTLVVSKTIGKCKRRKKHAKNKHHDEYDGMVEISKDDLPEGEIVEGEVVNIKKKH